MTITLTAEECKAVYDLVDQLSGFNANNVFDADGTNDPADPLTSAAAKVWLGAGKAVPKELEGVG